MTFQKKAPQKRDNAAKMVVFGQGDREPDQKLDLSYLENVVETTPEGTSTLAPATEVKPNAEPATLTPAVDESTVPSDKTEAQPPAPPAVEDDEIDDPKFKGKSKKEIYASHKELEARLGKQGNELGDYRKFFDQFMAKQLNQPQQQPHTATHPTASTSGQGADGDDEAKLLDMMLSRPKDFMRHVKQSLFGDLQTMGTTQILQQMDAKNADILQDPNFEAWALSNTTMAMRQQADVDPQARQFIFNSYRSMNGKPQNQPAAANTPAVDAAGAAPVPTTNRTVSVSPSVTGPSVTTSKPGAKIWSRAEIRDLVANDPAGYQKLSGEIAKAYAEGRVQK